MLDRMSGADDAHETGAHDTDAHDTDAHDIAPASVGAPMPHPGPPADDPLSVDPRTAELQALLDSPVHAVIVTSPDGVIRQWGASASRVLGYSADEMVGRPLSALFVEEDQDRGVPALELRVAASTGHAPDDRWHVRRDGSRIWASGSTLPLREEGRLVGFVKLLRDRTDSKIEIEALRRQVSDRERADARCVHELRNALAPLDTALAVLQRAPEQAAAMVPRLQRQLDGLKRLVADLAEATSAQHGKLHLHRQRFDLVAALRDLADGVAPRYAAKGLRFDVLLPAAAVEIDADPQRIRQVALNLLDNALKYTPAGGRVWLGLHLEDDRAAIHVMDTGVGVAADMLPRIFDFFTQEAEGTPGLGVGLAVVKEIVEAHGGVVEVRSGGKGLGADFAAQLPLSAAAG